MLLEFYNGDTLLAVFEYDNYTETVNRDNVIIYCKEKLPVYFDLKSLSDFGDYMEDWLTSRCVNNRKHIQKLYEALNLSNEADKVIYSYGLSLNDSFWIKRLDDKTITWKDINLYDNKFSYEIAQLSFLGISETNSETFNRLSPEPTTPGMVDKFWERRDDGVYLIKGDICPDYISEEIAYNIATYLGINSIHYSVELRKDKPVSICKLFTTKEIGLLPASRVAKMLNSSNSYNRFTTRAKEKNISLEGIQDMFILDFVIANIDRHLNNWAFSINNNTQEILGLTPIYDNGFSFFAQTVNEDHLRKWSDEIKDRGLFWRSFNRKYLDLLETETIEKYLPKIKTIKDNIDFEYSFRVNMKEIYRIKYIKGWIRYAIQELETELVKREQSQNPYKLNTVEFK